VIQVTAALLLENGQILLGRRKTGIRHAGKWEFPGGKIEPGETPQAGLARELREEFNIEAVVGDLFAESVYHYNRGPVRLKAYFAQRMGNLTPVDHDRIAWVNPESLLTYDLLPADIPLARKLITHLSR